MAESGTAIRKLTAILSADVAGYSRLMGADEAGTLTELKGHRREVIDPSVTSHGGRMVSTAGDGFLMEFPSAVSAVECAVAIQHDMAQRNDGVADDRRMEFRVGINVGDVIVDDDDIFGDGVNIAARIQALADTGGIYISGNVFDQVKNKVAVAYEDLGEQRVKNIADPVKVYRLRADQNDPTVALVAEEDVARVTPPRIPTVGVLPFNAMTGDPEIEHMADGLSENITTILSKAPGIFVIARNSTFTYKGTAVRVQQVAEDLGATYVIEGSIQKAGNRVRITAQLIEAKTGNHVWAERFDRTMDDPFALQDEISWEISDALRTHVTEGEQVRVWRGRTKITEAYDLTSQGYATFLKQNQEGNLRARDLWLKSLELDPSYAVPAMGVGWTYFFESAYGWGDDPMAEFGKAIEHAHMALALDSELPDGYGLMGILDLFQRKFDEAVVNCEKAVLMSPNHATVVALLAWVYSFVGKPQEALSLIDRAIQLSPSYPPYFLGTQGNARIQTGDLEGAVASFEQAASMNSNQYQVQVGLAAAYAVAGHQDKARAVAKQVLARNPDFTVQNWVMAAPYKNPADLERELDALRAAGFPEG
jgi:adenylate cyclase